MAASQLGWIGLGSMGIGMSRNLQAYLLATAAPNLLFTNRTITRGDILKDIGAIPVMTVAEVAKKSDIIFSCVSNDQVLEEVAREIVSSGSLDGKVYADCSTVHPETSTRVAAMIENAGGTFVAAPVFGAASMASAGKLIFVSAGPTFGTEKIAPFLTGVMGKSIIPMGTDVAKASLLKIAGNICIISFMEVISEAHVFAEKTGLGSTVLEAMMSDMFGPVIESYSKRLTTGAYAPNPSDKAGFDVRLAIKDARHALNCAQQAGCTLDVSKVALGHMERALETYPDRPLDSSSMYGIIRKDGELDFFNDSCKSRDN